VVWGGWDVNVPWHLQTKNGTALALIHVEPGVERRTVVSGVVAAPLF